jgi:hypothetical protein
VALGWGAIKMFDVYVSDKRDLLIVPKGTIPPREASTRCWRKTKKRLVSVSAEIARAVERYGYYRRKLGEFKSG